MTGIVSRHAFEMPEQKKSANGLKTEIEAFLTLLDAKNYGGKIPDENFYLK